MEFEEKMAKMEEITKTLQSNDTPLEKAIDLFEEGMKLAKEVDQQLAKIERRIEIVTSQAGESEEGVTTETYTEA